MPKPVSKCFFLFSANSDWAKRSGSGPGKGVRSDYSPTPSIVVCIQRQRLAERLACPKQVRCAASHPETSLSMGPHHRLFQAILLSKLPRGTAGQPEVLGILHHSLDTPPPGGWRSSGTDLTRDADLNSPPDCPGGGEAANLKKTRHESVSQE